MQYGNVEERVSGTVNRRNEAEAFRGIEPLEAGPDGLTSIVIEFVTKPRQGT
jgi:hypothetical protein